MNKTITTLACLTLLALLGACGGGSDSSSSGNGYTVSGGTVQKGPLVQGSSITVNTLSATTWQPSGGSYTFEITNNLGNFSAASTVFRTQYAESTALGYYFNELTGVVSNDMVYLRGLSDLKNDKSINLNVLTDMVRARIRALTTRTTSPLTFANARLQAQKELLAAFYIYNSADLLPTAGPANFNELDLSKTRNADQILAAISGVITQMGQNGSGINLALSRLELDLADDGQINNSPNYAASTITGLSVAETATNFTAVADNLNAFYRNANFTGTSVGQWIDSSGGVDRVIDRYKFSAPAATLNVESRSPFYLAGSDDVGQCMSVTAGKLYRKAPGAASATLVATATIKAVAGDQYQIGLTPTTSTLSGFIQRSAPGANGVCPTAVPNSGVIRVQKYSISTSGSAPYTYSLGGTVSGLATGKSITFLNNGVNATTVSNNGAFTFTQSLYAGSAYSVTVSSMPAGQTCSVGGATGTISTNVDNVSVNCETSTPAPSGFTIGGVVSGLDGGKSLQLENANPSAYEVITINSNGTFKFSLPSSSGSNYSVGFVKLPTGQSCSISNPSGIMNGIVSNVMIVCYGNLQSVLSTLAGSGQAGMINATGRSARFSGPTGIALDGVGNAYISDTGNNIIRKVTPSGVVTTYAGSGEFGTSNGIAGQPKTATFSGPRGIAVDSAGNVYIADVGNNMIRKISSSGVVSTLAGNGSAGYTDSVPGSTNGNSVAFNSPTGIAVDSSGNVYVADYNNSVIRKVLPTGVTSTLVGSGYIGLTDGNGTAAVLAYPLDLALDKLGNIFVAEQGNPTVRKVSIASRDVTTVMNGYTYNGYSGQGITVSSSGNVYLYSVCALYRLSPDGKGGLGPSSPNFDTRYEGITGDYIGCGYADAAPLTANGSISREVMSAIDSQGNLIFSDKGNNVIRKITLVDKAPTHTQYQLSK